MKSLPVLMSISMLTCLVSMPLGCLIPSLLADWFFSFEMDMQSIVGLWIASSIFGFPVAFFYGAPLYALCVRYYRPTWWLVLLIGGGPFWIFALDDLTDRFGGDSLLFLSYGISVAVSHHLLMTCWPVRMEAVQAGAVPSSFGAKPDNTPAAGPSGGSGRGPH